MFGVYALFLEMDINIDLSEATTFDVEWGYCSEETWSIGGAASNLSIEVSDVLSENIAKELASTWLPVKGEMDLSVDEFWLWLGDAVKRQCQWDGGYKLKPKQSGCSSPCIGDFY